MNSRKLLVSVLFTLLLFTSSGSVIFASTDSTTDDSTSVRTRTEVRTEIREQREETMEMRDEVKRERTEAREEFRERLSELRDKRKAAIVEKLVTKFDTVNDRWVAAWNHVLERLGLLLDKMESRTQMLADEGYDVSSVEDGIADAKSAIDSAQAALDTQEGKVYTVEITDEDSLRTDVSEAVLAFRADLQAVKDEVKSAQESVRTVLNLMKEVSSQTLENE